MQFDRAVARRRILAGAALLILTLTFTLAGFEGNVTGAARQGTAAATPGTDDPCAAVVAAGTPVAGHGEGPGALDPVPPEQSGELGSPADFPFDLVFIDAMIAHHEAAILTAEIALVRAEHEELRDLARGIVESRIAEVAQLREWRAAWYGDADPVPLNVTVGLMDEGLMLIGGPADTGAGMGGPVADTGPDVFRLCAATGSFDLAYIDLTIPHHQSAVGMALIAPDRAEHQELRTFAEAIVAARQGEIAQLTEWRIAWSAAGGTPVANAASGDA